MYNELNDLNSYIKNYQNELVLEKQKLGLEITQVKRRLKPMGKIRELTAQRIDITT